MRRRKKWKAPNSPTAQARQVWAHVYPGEPWPKGWTVEWAGFMRGVYGLTLYGRRTILLSYGDARRGMATSSHGCTGVVEVLCHEFIHMRCGKELRHGRDFQRLQRAAIGRLYGHGTA